MYRCDICQSVSKPKQNRLVHVLQRPAPGGRLVTDREIPVCVSCKTMLESGVPFAALVDQKGVALAPGSTAPGPMTAPATFNNPVSLSATAKPVALKGAIVTSKNGKPVIELGRSKRNGSKTSTQG